MQFWYSQEKMLLQFQNAHCNRTRFSIQLQFQFDSLFKRHQHQQWRQRHSIGMLHYRSRVKTALCRGVRQHFNWMNQIFVQLIFSVCFGSCDILCIDVCRSTIWPKVPFSPSISLAPSIHVPFFLLTFHPVFSTRFQSPSIQLFHLFRILAANPEMHQFDTIAIPWFCVCVRPHALAHSLCLSLSADCGIFHLHIHLQQSRQSVYVRACVSVVLSSTVVGIAVAVVSSVCDWL